MKTKHSPKPNRNAKAKQHAPSRKRPPTLLLQTPRFILFPFYGSRIRAILEGQETWYLREDVLKALSLQESPQWNRRLFANSQRTTARWIDGQGGRAEHKLISEAGFYKLLCLGAVNNVGLAFNLEGGSLIYDMPRPGEDFDTNQREFFRALLRDLHANWLQHEASDEKLDAWEMPRLGKAKFHSLN